jgi:MFS family permease
MADEIEPLTAEVAHQVPAALEESQPVHPAARGSRRSLWHHADYMKIWSAATVSLMGSAITQIALPYIATIFLNATAFEVAMLGMVDMLPFLLFTLPAGAWLDRVRRRPVLVFGDLGRAVALSTIPLAYALDTLTIWQLYVVGFTTGLLTVFFDVADQSYLPALLEPEDLVEGNAKLQISGSAAQIVGPGLGGVIVGVVTAPFAILLDAASFVASGGLISLVRKHEPKPERRVAEDGRHTSLRRDISDGLRYVMGNAYLSKIAGATGTSNLGGSIMFAILPVFAYRELGLHPSLVGLALGLGGFGILAGAFAAQPLSRRFGTGPVIVGSIFLNAPFALMLALMPSAAVVAGALMIGSQLGNSFSSVVYNVNQVSFRQAITPLDMQGRMNATMRFIVWGTMPIGAIIGGVLATFLPLRTTMLIGVLVSSVAFLWVLFSPVRSLREIPTSRDKDGATPGGEATIEDIPSPDEAAGGATA